MTLGTGILQELLLASLKDTDSRTRGIAKGPSLDFAAMYQVVWFSC